FIATENNRRGPMRYSELLRLAENGDLPPSSLVWSPGQPDWIPVAEHPKLADLALDSAAQPSVAPSSTSAGVSVSGTEVLSGFARVAVAWWDRGVPLPHVGWIDTVLDSIRNVGTPRGLEIVDRLAIRLGHLAYFLATFLFLVFALGAAVQADSPSFFLLGGGWILAFAWVGQYAASNFLDARDRCLEETPDYVPTRAMRHLLALLAFLSAGSMGAIAIVSAVEEESVAGVGAFGALTWLLAYVGVATLDAQETSFKVKVHHSEASEVMGLGHFLIRLQLRLAPMGYFIGAVFGVGIAVGLLVGLIRNDLALLFLQRPFGFESPMELVTVSLTLAWIPFAAYLIFVLGSWALGIARSFQPEGS
ncbi:MAG: DUF4339 domain-containing protein, partial [Acidobacteriota bacterium]